ncbi:hypothetical protein Tco_0904012 [Tanacetum coccineum]
MESFSIIMAQKTTKLLMFIQMNGVLPTRVTFLMDVTRKLISSMCNVPPESKIFDEYLTIQHCSSSSFHDFNGTVLLAYFDRGRQIKGSAQVYADKTTSAPRSPNPDKEVAESSALSRSTVIRLRLPKWRATSFLPQLLKQDENVLALVVEHLASEERIEDGGRNETLYITYRYYTSECTDEDEFEITDEGYELKRRRKGRTVVEETRNSPIPYTIRSRRIYIISCSSATEKTPGLTDTLLLLHHQTNTVKKSYAEVPEQVRNQVPVYVAEGLILERQKAKEETKD